MEIHRPNAPITLDGFHRQLQLIAQKVNKALKPTSLLPFGGIISNQTTPGAIDPAVISSALSDSDALLSQIRSACEDFAQEPSVLQLEAAAHMQRAKIEHCGARFRQSSAAYEQAAKLLLSVEQHRSPVFTTHDALNQAVTCVLYACAELVEAAASSGKFILHQNSNTAAAAAAAAQSREASAVAAAAQAQQQAQAQTDSNSKNATSATAPAAASEAQKAAENPKSIGSRLSNWFKGLPSIQPANSQAAQIAAQEAEQIRRQREAERVAKQRSEAVWRLLPADCPHRFVSTARVASLLRCMARELLRFDCIDLASHFADLAGRYCLDYVTPTGLGEAVPPPAATTTLVPVRTALCRLPAALRDPDVEFCAVKPVAPTVRFVFAESLLLSVSCALAMRQYERVRVMATFALYVLEPQRGSSFTLSVPADMEQRNAAAALQDPAAAATSKPVPTNAPASYFVPVSIMRSFSAAVKDSEECALLGLCIVIAALSARRLPFSDVATAHVSWWREQFATVNNSSSEFVVWRAPVADALDAFVAAVVKKQQNATTSNDEDDDIQTEIFMIVDRLRQLVLSRHQMIGLAAHRLFSIYCTRAEEVIAPIVPAPKFATDQDDHDENDARNAAQLEAARSQGATSPKLGLGK